MASGSIIQHQTAMTVEDRRPTSVSHHPVTIARGQQINTVVHSIPSPSGSKPPIKQSMESIPYKESSSRRLCTDPITSQFRQQDWPQITTGRGPPEQAMQQSSGQQATPRPTAVANHNKDPATLDSAAPFKIQAKNQQPMAIVPIRPSTMYTRPFKTHLKHPSAVEHAQIRSGQIPIFKGSNWSKLPISSSSAILSKPKFGQAEAEIVGSKETQFGGPRYRLSKQTQTRQINVGEVAQTYLYVDNGARDPPADGSDTLADLTTQTTLAPSLLEAKGEKKKKCLWKRPYLSAEEELVREDEADFQTALALSPEVAHAVVSEVLAEPDFLRATSSALTGPLEGIFVTIEDSHSASLSRRDKEVLHPGSLPSVWECLATTLSAALSKARSRVEEEDGVKDQSCGCLRIGGEKCHGGTALRPVRYLARVGAPEGGCSRLAVELGHSWAERDEAINSAEAI
ncbi:hypothetical protein ACLOJK_034377 [Asimina triloba]